VGGLDLDVEVERYWEEMDRMRRRGSEQWRMRWVMMWFVR
jgi:hypothetical protein